MTVLTTVSNIRIVLLCSWFFVRQWHWYQKLKKLRGFAASLPATPFSGVVDNRSLHQLLMRQLVLTYLLISLNLSVANIRMRSSVVTRLKFRHFFSLSSSQCLPLFVGCSWLFSTSLFLTLQSLRHGLICLDLINENLALIFLRSFNDLLLGFSFWHWWLSLSELFLSFHYTLSSIRA